VVIAGLKIIKEKYVLQKWNGCLNPLDGGSYKITSLPIPAEPPYQTAVRLPYTWGGQRTVQDTSSILFLRVISNGINVGGDRLIADDILKYEI